MNRTPQQLSLGVTLSDDATFANFYADPASVQAQAVAALRLQVATAEHSFIYLRGAPGSGLSHLLQAGCHHAQQAGLSIQYLPLADLAGYAPADLCTGLETLDYVALDDLDAVAGRPDWELVLFTLYNRMREEGGRLLVAAHQAPRDLPLNLEDLRSRLQWGLTFYLTTLPDDQKQQALRARARARGLDLSDEVAHYLLQRLPRDTHDIFQQLDLLDSASLAEQRKLTIPFVKKVLAL